MHLAAAPPTGKWLSYSVRSRINFAGSRHSRARGISVGDYKLMIIMTLTGTCTSHEVFF
jgi:hypothetical protein